MFNYTDSPHSEALDGTITDLLTELDALSGSSDEYTKTATNLAKLMELKNQILKTCNETHKVDNDQTKIDRELHLSEEELQINQRKIDLDEKRFRAEQEMTRSWKPSPDAVVTAAASVASILFVLHYEKIGVVTSKALGFIGKLK